MAMMNSVRSLLVPQNGAFSSTSMFLVVDENAHLKVNHTRAKQAQILTDQKNSEPIAF